MTLQYHKKNFPKEKSPANGHQKITTAPMTENSGGPAKKRARAPLAVAMSALRSRSLLRSVQLRSPTPGLPALPLRKPPVFFLKRFSRLGSKPRAPDPAVQGRFFTENKFQQKTATGSMCVWGGQFARKQFFRGNRLLQKNAMFCTGKVRKDCEIFQPSKADIQSQRSLAKPSPKDNVHRRFFKKQKFSTIFNLNRRFPGQNVHTCKILTHGSTGCTIVVALIGRLLQH